MRGHANRRENGKGRCRRIAGRSLLVVVIVSSFGLSRKLTTQVLTNPDSGAVIPFVLKEQLESVPKGKVFNLVTIARRSDGAYARSEYLRPMEQGYTVRSIRYIDGEIVTISEQLGMKTTGPRESDEQVAHATVRLFRPPANCQPNGTEDVKGFGAVSGQRVAIVSQPWRPSVTSPLDKMQITNFRAPQLGCETLEYSVEVAHPDGTRYILDKARVVSLTLGDPDESLFEVSPTLTEVLPSEMWRRYAEIRGVSPTPQEAETWAREDEAYYSAR